MQNFGAETSRKSFKKFNPIFCLNDEYVKKIMN
jgi:hypothetical protein